MELLFKEESSLADSRKCRGYGYYEEITFIPHGCGIKYFSAYNSYGKSWIDQVDCPAIVSTKITKEGQLVQNYPTNRIGGRNSINRRCYTESIVSNMNNQIWDYAQFLNVIAKTKNFDSKVSIIAQTRALLEKWNLSTAYLRMMDMS
ncbi:hypothetical protein C5O25_08805 [Paramuribaculum intestinale]|uniref:Uncharacterized protein n=2 Tax=Bacteroidales TaxID=171549 RepID=A0A2V1ISY4_9BACT|nr:MULTISPECIES: hypothetical protein [Bacteroidales]PWB06985.1 hypothetical protein C5O25_08805 [Paramuribaculum intestinale]ROS89970.1 hypothetical protein EEL36_12755 [Muribaculaceae bacterium Isolate-043 (Harlan)]WLT42409.1 hypothetical protein NF347_02315 [Paramuribaculum intestinale]